jgi:MFS family permease
MFLMGAALYGGMLLLPLSFQDLRGTDALGAGLLLIPQGVGSLLSRSIAGRLTDRIGARIVAVLGFGVVLVATIPFAFMDASTNAWWILAVLVVRGVGLGAVMIPIMAVGFVGLARDEIPHGSTITRLAQQLGAAFGTATLAVVLSTASLHSNPVEAFHDAFWCAIGFTVIAMIVSVILPGRPTVIPGVAKAPTSEHIASELSSP